VKPLSLYIDTSVIGGYFDPEFTIATRELWRQMEKGQYRFYASSSSVGEVARAPGQDGAGSICRGCHHVAVAVVHKMDMVASWNFKHLVNVHRERALTR
jgi:hypothetical protein